MGVRGVAGRAWGCCGCWCGVRAWLAVVCGGVVGCSEGVDSSGVFEGTVQSGEVDGWL